MRGCVMEVHLNGAFAVLTNDGRRLQFRLTLGGGIVMPGDNVAWTDDLPLVVTEIRNLTQHTRFDVAVIDSLGIPGLSSGD